MRVYDPLYGRYELSHISSELCLLPEVRRLSQIRLLNSISPSLATLSELRRYAHTLGVLNLFNVWKKGAGRRYSSREQDALEVAIILHDVATPPFGHLFEYILKDDMAWDHEAEAVATLLKDYSSTSTAQPIFAGKTPKVLDRIERRGIDLDLLKKILSKQHPLSCLIMGVLDFDNIDNVWRMAWALGMPLDPMDGMLLAQTLDVDTDGTLLIEGQVSRLLESWAQLRRSVYNVLIFDQPTVASQSVLTHCIRTGLVRNLISNEDWFLTDEALLRKLSVDEDLRTLIAQQYLGVLPVPVLTIQTTSRGGAVCGYSRVRIETDIQDCLRAFDSGAAWWVYVFKEKGSFEKQVRYLEKDGKAVVFGETSASIVVSIFSDKPPSSSDRKAAVKAVVGYLQRLGIDANDYLRIIESGDESVDASRGLFF